MRPWVRVRTLSARLKKMESKLERLKKDRDLWKARAIKAKERN